MSSPPEPDRSFEPVRSRRTYGPPMRRRRLEDARDRAIFLRALLWSPAGLILGLAAGWFGKQQLGWPSWLMFLAGVIGWAFVFGLPLGITWGAGRAGGIIYAPSGRSTPRPRDHSRARTLVARGLYRDAVVELVRAAEDDPTDASAWLDAARVLRDHLGEHEEAAGLFRRALKAGVLSPGRAGAVRRELIELYVHRLRAPERAAPELARLADEGVGTAEGTWAAGLLADVKRRLAQERSRD